MKAVADAAPKLFDHFFRRPLTVVDLDKPLLVMGDEPVVVVTDRPPAHRPDCAMTPEERARAVRRSVKAGRGMREMVHIYPTRPSGVAVAEQIILPVGPSRALVLGEPNTDEPPYLSMTGEEARKGATQLNKLMIGQAYLWVAAHPEHPEIKAIDIPECGPLFHICDGDSAASAAMSSVPSPFMPQRLGRRP